MTTFPLAQLDESTHDTLKKLSAGAAGLMIAAVFGLMYLSKEVEIPIRILETSVAEANRTAGDLAKRLLHVQEDEHHRIAGELHDSTAQHLVGALFELISIDKKLGVGRADSSTMAEVKRLVEQALNELRTFSFLLHPRNLGDGGLAEALKDFVQSLIFFRIIRASQQLDFTTE